MASQISNSSFEYLISETIDYLIDHHSDPEDDLNEKMGGKIETIGFSFFSKLNKGHFSTFSYHSFNAGYRYMESVSRVHNVPLPALDRVKFLCREFWSKLFEKNMSRLQTNHRDMFVLTGWNI